MIAHVFAYGTLLPGQARWYALEPYVHGTGEPDEAFGELYDTGRGYPAAVFVDVSLVDVSPEAGRIEGRTFELQQDHLDRALQHLDDVEGAVGGLYRRIEIRTVNGVHAWAYQYGGGLQLSPIESGSWID